MPCVWQEDVCSRMPRRKPYGAKWQNWVGPVSSLLADTLPQCGMVLNECRSSHSLTLWSLFFHLYPTAVLHQIQPPPIFPNPLSLLFYSSSAHWSSSWCELWWVLWNLGSSSLKVSPIYPFPILKSLIILGTWWELVHKYVYACFCVFYNWVGFVFVVNVCYL